MRKLFLLLTAFFVCYNLQAQTSLGIKAGLNTSTFDEYSIYYETGWRIGFHGGGMARIKLPGRYFFQPELLYSLKGTRLDLNNSGDEAKVSLHYITLPLMAGFQANDHFSVMAGLEPGFKFTAYNHAGDRRSWVSKSYEKLDVSAALGISYKVTDALGVDGRYSHGLVTIHHEEFWSGNGVYTEWNRRNRVFQVGLYYLFSHR